MDRRSIGPPPASCYRELDKFLANKYRQWSDNDPYPPSPGNDGYTWDYIEFAIATIREVKSQNLPVNIFEKASFDYGLENGPYEYNKYLTVSFVPDDYQIPPDLAGGTLPSSAELNLDDLLAPGFSLVTDGVGRSTTIRFDPIDGFVAVAGDSLAPGGEAALRGDLDGLLSAVTLSGVAATLSGLGAGQGDIAQYLDALARVREVRDTVLDINGQSLDALKYLFENEDNLSPAEIERVIDATLWNAQQRAQDSLRNVLPAVEFVPDFDENGLLNQFTESIIFYQTSADGASSFYYSSSDGDETVLADGDYQIVASVGPDNISLSALQVAGPNGRNTLFLGPGADVLHGSRIRRCRARWLWR